jgi:predicted ATPase
VILEVGADGARPARWDELEHVRVTRAFLNAPDSVLARLLPPTP